MSYEVDTQEVRRIAQQIKEIAADVKELSKQNVRRMQNNVEDNMRGETAQALEGVLEDLSDDILKISSGLDAIQRELMAYARRVDAADRDAERLLAD